ncbi:MAG: cytochrome C [Bryobacteraceae bacterium]
MPGRNDQRYLRIAMTSALMLAVVMVVGSALYSESSQSRPAQVKSRDTPSLPVEAGPFLIAAQAQSLSQAPEEENARRTLKDFYASRAYPGAPPMIPHRLLDNRGFGGRSCLICHGKGGYVPSFKAYAPVTPHPEMVSCLQCHLPQKEEPLFSGIDWKKIDGPPRQPAAMAGAPLQIPHSLHMRENCLSCHGGPGAVAEIRTSHPERINCRQCHVTVEEQEDFQRTP